MSFGLAFATVSAVRPAASYKAIALGGSGIEVGLVAGAFGLFALLAAIPIGARIDRSGERGYALAGSLTLVLAPLMQRWATGIPMLVLGQALLGLGQVALAIAMHSVAADTKSGGATDTRFAGVAVAASLGLLLGPALTGLAIDGALLGLRGRTGPGSAYLAGSSVATIGFLAALLRPRSTIVPAPDPNRRPRLRTLLATPHIPEALATSIAVVVTLDVLLAYLPVLGEERGIRPSLIGFLLSLRALSAIVSRLTLPLMLRLVNRTRLLTMMLILAGAAMCGVAVTSQPWVLALFVSIAGFALGVGSPMTASSVAAAAPQDARAAALGLRIGVNRVGQTVVPALLGAVVVVAGALGAMLGSAVALVASSIFARLHETSAARSEFDQATES